MLLQLRMILYNNIKLILFSIYQITQIAIYCNYIKLNSLLIRILSYFLLKMGFNILMEII